MAPSCVLLPLFLSSVVLAAGDDVPNPIYNAETYTKIIRSVPNGKLYQVDAPLNTSLRVMHLFGTASQRGTAHGQLLSSEIVEFVTSELAGYFRAQVAQLPLDKLPAWLAKDLKALLEKEAPAAFDIALNWVWSRQEQYIATSKTNVLDEMSGLADGICDSSSQTGAAGSRSPPSICKLGKTKVLNLIHAVNMLPELVRMQCSMMGAWGAATPSGQLTQLRSLDFGGGPFANRNILIVHHPSSEPTGKAGTSDSVLSAPPPPSFASLSFPGFVGVVTGLSERVSLSEKVDDVTNGRRPQGTYDGQAVAFVIRDMLELSSTKEDAVAIAQAARRTWSVWLGVGDESSQKFVAMLYDEAAAIPYNDSTLPSLTNQTAFKGVAYIDKHPQPSGMSRHPDMPNLIQRFYGNLSGGTVAQYIPRLMQSGDVHIAIYDWHAQQVLIATGTTDGPNGKFTRLAHDAPYLRFNTSALWAEPIS